MFTYLFHKHVIVSVPNEISHIAASYLAGSFQEYTSLYIPNIYTKYSHLLSSDISLTDMMKVKDGDFYECTSLSSIVQTAVLGLLMIAELELEMERDDERGYLKFTLPEKLEETQDIQHKNIMIALPLFKKV